MEKENGKKRAVARRKYQDDVRALVEFCRRRDRRVIRHKLQLAKQKDARWVREGIGQRRVVGWAIGGDCALLRVAHAVVFDR